MKVGILTFHRTTNYGATLQAYALQRILQSMDNEVEIIDYRNMKVYSYSDPRFFHGMPVKTRIGKLIRYRYNSAIFNRFSEFWEKYFCLSPMCTTHEELGVVEEHYDTVICGSDQVWNPRAIFNDFDAFLLGTAKRKKIAYAASAGSVSLWEPYLKTFWRLLHRFDAISVREESMKAPSEHLSQKDVYVGLDPTLLLENKDWCKIEDSESLKHLPKNGYILVYFLGKNPAVVRAAQELQRKTGLPVISLGRKLHGIRSLRPIAGPAEFLTLFHHASYVLTSSFHGTVFSIQYQRPFLVFGNGACNSRMTTLLNAIGLQDRMIGQPTVSPIDKLESPINWEQVQNCLNQKKQRSIAFLDNNLK